MENTTIEDIKAFAKAGGVKRKGGSIA